MPRNEYQTKLEDLEDDVLYMGEVVAERLRMGLDALEQKDSKLGEEVIEGEGGQQGALQLAQVLFAQHDISMG